MNANSKTDWARLEAMKDEDVDLSDVPELSQDQLSKMRVVMPNAVKPRTIVLSPDVAASFESDEEVNEALRLVQQIRSLRGPERKTA
jgi:hypothetical protein